MGLDGELLHGKRPLGAPKKRFRDYIKTVLKKAVFHLLRLRFKRETESDGKRYARLASTTYCSP